MNEWEPKRVDVSCGEAVKKPNTKLPPSSENSNIFSIKFPIPSKIFCPNGTFKIKTAKKIWRANPPKTVFRLIFFLFFVI